MKKLLSILLCFSLLCGCSVFDPGGDVISGTPSIGGGSTVRYPQTGEYRETALMANIPGQGCPLLLSVRSDGTVDYIFADIRADYPPHTLDSFAGSVQYYTLTPGGQAEKQSGGWMEKLDAYTAEAEASYLGHSPIWDYFFTAEEGVILILARLRSGDSQRDSGYLHSALFKLENGELSKVPILWELETDQGILPLDTVHTGGIAVEDGRILLDLTYGPGLDQGMIAAYDFDGSVAEVTEVPYNTLSLNMITNEFTDSREPTPPLTEDNTLYSLGRAYPNQLARAMGPDGTFYCWFEEVSGGLLMQYKPNPEEKIDPEVVTVWSAEHIGLIQTAVAQWNHTHASPIFRYETAQSAIEGTNLTMADELTRLNLELSSGQGPDVLILDGLNVDAMLEFLAPLDALDTGGVYENLLERFTIDGSLYALPTRMNPYLLGRTAEDTLKIESLADFADLVTTATGVLDLSYEFGDAYRYYDALYNVSSCDEVFQLWYPAWADAIWEGGRFRAEVFEEFLTQTERLVAHYSLTPAGDYLPEDRSILGVTDGKMWGNSAKRPFPYTLAVTDYVGLYAYWWYNDTGKQESIPCVIESIPGPDGSGVAVPKYIAGIRAGGNEPAGMEFLQLLLSDQIQLGGQYYSPGLADGYPVKRGCLDTLIERTEAYMDQEFAVENDFDATLTSLRAVVIEELPWQAAFDAAIGYYTGELTLAEAVAQAEEDSSLYLAEQRR